MPAHEELVVDVLGLCCVQSEAGVTQQIPALRRLPEDVRPEPTLGDDRTERVQAWSTVGPNGGDEPERRSVLVDEGLALLGQLGSSRLELRPRRQPDPLQERRARS